MTASRVTYELSISYGIKIKEYGIWKTKFQSDVDDKCKPYVKLTQMVKYLYSSLSLSLSLSLSVYIYIVDVVEWSRALDVRLSEWCCSVSMV